MLGGIDYVSPSRFVSTAYRAYRKTHPQNASVNGRVFEYCIAEVLIRNGIVPFYHQARLAFVPNVEFDFICYHPSRPVVLSCKTSLRERYKQADLEGMAIRQVYRQAQSHLLTLSESEAVPLQAKISLGDVLGLSSCVCADSAAFDSLIDSLAGMKFEFAQPVTPIQGEVFPASPI